MKVVRLVNSKLIVEGFGFFSFSYSCLLSQFFVILVAIAVLTVIYCYLITIYKFTWSHLILPANLHLAFRQNSAAFE